MIVFNANNVQVTRHHLAQVYKGRTKQAMPQRFLGSASTGGLIGRELSLLETLEPLDSTETGHSAGRKPVTGPSE